MKHGVNTIFSHISKLQIIQLNRPALVNKFCPFSLNIKGNIRSFTRPCVMGIINVTPDSFYDGSRTQQPGDIEAKTSRFLQEGADMIDIGAYSSRPGAADVSEREEMERLKVGISAVRRVSPEIPLSVDTFRSRVARYAIEELGADIINDISGWTLDKEMLNTVEALNVPYILMHMRGTPADMQQFTEYSNVTVDVTEALSVKLAELENRGVKDVIIDPGFGFSKTLEQNYELLRNLPHLTETLKRPMLVGVSRKSMFTKALGITAEEALNATTAANTIAMMQGASIIRVHDVAAACQARQIVSLTVNSPRL